MGCGGSTEATGPVSGLQSIPPASKEPKSGSSTPRSKNKSKAAAEAPLVGRTDARIGALLKDVPLLQNFSEKDLNLLGGAMQKERFKVGESVFKQGDVGDRFYIIVSGSANVVMKDENSGENRDVGFLTQGDYFGETALQHDQPRGAAIVAQKALELLSLSKEKFQKLIGTGHHVHFVNRRIGISAEAGGKKEGQERADPDAIDTHLAPPNAVREKSDEVHKLIYDTVSDSLLFTGMSEEHIQAIIGHMYRQEVEAGASPVRQGDPGSNLFVVEQGEFFCFVEGVEESVATRGPGSIFGELALMYNAPRAATVTAQSKAVVWKVDRYTFRRIARDVGEGALADRIGFLSKVPVLAPLTSLERAKIAEAMDDVVFPAGTVVFDYGDEGDAMYIIKSGQVDIMIPEGDDVMMNRSMLRRTHTTKLGVDSPREVEDTRQSILVNQAKARDYFGERALLTNEPRAAKVQCETVVEALVLKKHDMKLLLGPLKDIMEERMSTYGTDAMVEREDSGDEENLMEDIPFSDLKVVGTLGKGSFGHVMLTRNLKTGETYALKKVNKQQIVDTHQQEHIISEKKVMMRMDHFTIIRLFNTYKDKDNLYFLMEPVMGGELFSLLRRRRLFKETTARFYAACVILAFDYLHRKETVYRDLKPENLLLDDKGYIKITDFGFAKRIANTKTWTLCGTPDYLAPEIVSGRGHGKGVDWWTVGVLIYEMVASYTPFYHQNQLKMYDKIVRGKYRFPSHFSRAAKKIISEFLEHKAIKRLGILAGGTQGIKEHEWFDGFSWDELNNRTMAAPIPIKVKDKLDLSNFEVYDDSAVGGRPYKDDGTGWDREF